MRWDNLTIQDSNEQASLPGHRDPATVRRFDAPEAMDTRFYEIRAKSGLNRVPQASQMPFRWTINPFRGCAHSCTYCLGPDTPILLADGSTKRICDLQVGERIVGTQRKGRHRRYVETDVRDVWETTKPGYRVRLANGTTLLASGDHRFLSERSWRFVAEQPEAGAHLTPDDTLLGPGRLATGRPIVDAVVEPDPGLRVVAIESVGSEVGLIDITTGTGDFIAGGVVSHNCFARPTHTYLDFDAGRDFEREIVVKVNIPELVRAELHRPSWKGEHVALGTNTDPYQWVESKYELMRGIWEAMRDARNPCSLLTRSPLVLRDLDLLRELVEVTDFHANLSVPTLDVKAWRATEPRSPHPRKRIEAIAELNANGIPCGALIAPLMPGINDGPEQIEALLEALIDAGVTGVSGTALHLRADVKGLWFDFLRQQRPELVERYEALYADGAYAPSAERARLANLLRQAGAPPATGFRMRRRERKPAKARGGENRACVQEALF